MQSATYSPSAGPCLNPCPEPPPSEPPARLLGVPGDEEVGVARQVVLADARPDDRSVGEGREAAGGVGAGARLGRRVGQPLEHVGVDLGAAAVGCDLHPEPAELAVAVEGAVVIAEAGRARPGAVDAEEEDVAARDALLDEARGRASAATSRRPRRRRRHAAARPASAGPARPQVAGERARRRPRVEHARGRLEAAPSCRSSPPSDG